MARLIYSAIASLDGYVADADGVFDWAEPDEEVHTAINDLIRPVGTHLYGRRMYETMAGWETAHTRPDVPRYMLDFADIWQTADKIVYSTTCPWSCWTSAASATGWSTSITAPPPDQTPAAQARPADRTHLRLRRLNSRGPRDAACPRLAPWEPLFMVDPDTPRDSRSTARG